MFLLTNVRDVSRHLPIPMVNGNMLNMSNVNHPRYKIKPLFDFPICKTMLLFLLFKNGEKNASRKGILKILFTIRFI